MVDPPAHAAQQQEVAEAAPQGLLRGEDRVGVVLHVGQDDGLHVHVRVFVGVEVPDDQIGPAAEGLHVPQSAVAVDGEVIRPKQGPRTGRVPEIRRAHDQAAGQSSVRFQHGDGLTQPLLSGFPS